MDYKKIIKDRGIRIAILKIFDFVPDKMMLMLQYRIKTGRKLNLKNPRRYTEKLQWYKLYYHDPLMSQCVDKFEVRKYVEKCGLNSILNEHYGVFDSPEDINFDNLPDKFVLKDTMGSGGNSVIVCKNKRELDISQTLNIMQEWIKPNMAKNPGREWVYDKKKHRILIEKYIDADSENGGLVDYKFFCFNGNIFCVYVMNNRFSGVTMKIYDENFEDMNACIRYDKKMDHDLPRPKNYDQMCEIAKKLAQHFPHARIDLYNQAGKCIFGEITFFSGSGYTLFDPDKFDLMMGDAFKLPPRKK